MRNMEYQLTKEVCKTSEVILEGTKEVPVDLDLTLPDYCPDIEKLLKCRLSPSVTSKSISGDMLEIEGNMLISLYYLDSRKQAVRSCEHSAPFSCSFTVRHGADDALAMIRLRIDYLNCRALSPRRVDIHGAFSVVADVIAASDQEYYSAIQGDDIQQKKAMLTVSRLCAASQQQFSITEVLDIGQGKGFPESILRSELAVSCGSVKALTDKLMVSGEAYLRILYVTDIESGAQDVMTFNIPFSQVLDAKGISDTTTNEVTVEVMNYDTALKSEYEENSTLVTLDARLCATVTATEDAPVELVVDAYSTDYELETENKQYKFTRLRGLLNEEFSVKSEVNTGDCGISRVIDLWCDSVSSLWSVDNDVLTVRGKATCCILALDREGVPYYVERPIDFTAEPEAAGMISNPSVKTEVRPTGLSFRITGENSLEIKLDMRLTGSVSEQITVKGIVGARCNDDRCRLKDKTAALTLYYAEKGESLWDIACAYCTSAEAIRLENEMTEDLIPADGMILIPM